MEKTIWQTISIAHWRVRACPLLLANNKKHNLYLMYLFKKKKDGAIRLEFVVLSNAFMFFQLVAHAKPVNTDPTKWVTIELQPRLACWSANEFITNKLELAIYCVGFKWEHRDVKGCSKSWTWVKEEIWWHNLKLSFYLQLYKSLSIWHINQCFLSGWCIFQDTCPRKRQTPGRPV